MLRQTTAVFVALAITGCASRAPSLPEGYTGPQAQLDDSAKTYGSSKADFFFVEQIDGADVDNSLHETLSRNRGKGMHMTPNFITRAVMAEKPIKVALKGRTHYAAPIQALTRTVFEVKGVVEFTPRSNVRYVVCIVFNRFTTCAKENSSKCSKTQCVTSNSRPRPRSNRSNWPLSTEKPDRQSSPSRT